MRGCLSWFLLLPLVGAFWLVVTVSNLCVKKGDSWRILGILVSIAVGGTIVLIGYWFGIEGFMEYEGLLSRQVTYPVIGWLLMIGGGIVGLLGIWTATVGNKEEIELRERLEKQQHDKE